MASRNRLINGPVGEAEFHVKPFASVLYRAGGSDLFTDREKYEEALKSGEWFNSPAKVPKVEPPKEEDPEKHECCPYWIDGNCTLQGEPETEKEPEKEMTAEELAETLRKPETPIDPTKITRQLEIRNLAELRATGMPLGLDFPKDWTRKQMILAIRAKRQELKAQG